jgi:UDP-N-acetylglucosamine:LPS N-acetylglucosamine transferase
LKKILFISGSLGLGHIIRDIKIADELRKHYPDLKIDWIAASPASDLLIEKGEKLLPDSRYYANENIVAESMSKNNQLNLAHYIFKSQKTWKTNVNLYKEITTKTKYDLVIGDETYELFEAITKDPSIKNSPFVMIFDFIGMESTTSNLFEKFICYYFNYKWSKHYKRDYIDLSLFIGELEDVPDKSFGFQLLNRRKYAKERIKFVGYIVPFNPEDFLDKVEMKKKLGYSQEPLILCTVGGTSIGKELLELFCRSYPYMKEYVNDIQMVAVAGPRIDVKSLSLVDGVQVHGYVPDLYLHFAAADVVITQGGGGTTLEVAALQKPFIYFPVEGHFEQEVHVAGRLERHGIGIRMNYSETDPKLLASQILSLIGKRQICSLPLDGAENVAKLIYALLKETS